jgi:hypothetical protein
LTGAGNTHINRNAQHKADGLQAGNAGAAFATRAINGAQHAAAANSGSIIRALERMCGRAGANATFGLGKTTADQFHLFAGNKGSLLQCFFHNAVLFLIIKQQSTIIKQAAKIDYTNYRMSNTKFPAAFLRNEK